MKSKTKHTSTQNMNERKWPLPQLQLITKSCVRQELGLPTSSAAVLPLKMMPCTMFQSIQTFSVNGKFTEFIDRELQSGYFIHFGFVMCVNSRLYCTIFFVPLSQNM